MVYVFFCMQSIIRFIIIAFMYSSRNLMIKKSYNLCTRDVRKKSSIFSVCVSGKIMTIDSNLNVSVYYQLHNFFFTKRTDDFFHQSVARQRKYHQEYRIDRKKCNMNSPVDVRLTTNKLNKAINCNKSLTHHLY